MALCLHVATVGADERGAEAGEHQRLPALPDGRAAGGLADVLSFLSGQIGFSLQGMTCSHALSVKRVGPPVPCNSTGCQASTWPAFKIAAWTLRSLTSGASQIAPP